jgi:oxygen-independent coproporphyrinogen-3 oxidase
MNLLRPAPATPPPLAIYVHLPWCIRKCPYCDFNSHTATELPERAYLDALRADLEQAVPDIWGRRVHTVFFGGGTPSLFSGEAIDELLTLLRTLTRLDPDAEVTLEANPGTVEAGRFAAYRQAGVTRLSLGVQSFDDARLAGIGRIHDGQAARRAVEIAAACFDNFNLDLMYALPGQQLADWKRELDTALALAPPHLSCYHLTLEPHTPFGHAPPAGLPDDDTAADMQDWLEERLAHAGYTHYETSAFARPRRRCAHNLNYWQFGDYLGLGAGAHSKLSFHDRIERRMQVKHPVQYMEKAMTGQSVAEKRVLTRAELPFEFMMNAMRLVEGVPASLFAERCGLPLAQAEPALAYAEQRGLLRRDHVQLAPTPLGRRFLNDLLQAFLPPEKPA